MENLVKVLIITSLLSACTAKPEEISIANSNEGKIVNNAFSLTSAQQEAIDLKLGKLQKAVVDSSIKATGYIKVPPQNMASASTFIAGYVKDIYYLEGEYVKKGQALAQLENPEYLDLQELYLKTKNDLAFLKDELERQAALGKENINAGKSVIKAETEYNNILAQHNSIQKKLMMLGLSLEKVENGEFSSIIKIKSPISGYITHVNVSLGKYVTPSEELFKLIDKSHLHVELKIFEHDAIKVKNGQKVFFSVPGFAEKIYEGEVFLVGQTLEGESRTATVHAHIKGNEHDFMANMYVNASIIVGENEGLVVPENAVVQSEGKSFIFVEQGINSKGSEFEKVEVSTGFVDKGFILIHPLQEFDPQANIVTEGAFYLARAFEANKME